MRAPRAAALVWALSLVIVGTFVVTLTRQPVSQKDEPFYASIARAYHYGPPGVPSMLDASAPTAVDHIAFYGPIYFRTVDLFFSLFGVSVAAFRAIGLLGVLLCAAAGVCICRALGGGPSRQAWTWLLLLLTPEAGAAASSGRMDSMAVGIEMSGLAILLAGFARQRRPVLYGLGAGTLFAAAALTTPRTFPFLAALVIAGIVEQWRAAPVPRATRRVGLAAVASGGGILLAWTLIRFGGPAGWVRLMATIATHENTDVALLPAAAARDLMFTSWQAIPLVFSVAGALAAAYLMRSRDATPQALAGAFALVATWTTLVLTITLFNYTFIFGVYFVMPLTAVVIALPTPLSALHRRAAAGLALLLCLLFGGVRAAKIVRAAITWDARDPSKLARFVADHVPPGSRVLGPGPDLFLPVERAGSRYYSVPQLSFADWSRWSHPEAQGKAVALPAADFLIWRTRDGDPPRDVACFGLGPVATYHPPPVTLPRLAWILAADPFAGYPETTLYALGHRGGCGL
ncbi:MAG TPA: hypothetical protein VGI12_15210 [Vicinamibacterales bacterium]